MPQRGRMTELVNGSTKLSNNSAAVYAANLLRYYSFELGEYSIDQLLSHWLKSYPINWIRLATIEALYQGRYKAISVEQILAFWQRRGEPFYHFNHEFERLVCEKFPRNLVPPAAFNQVRSAQESLSLLEPGMPYRRAVLQLPSLKATSRLREPIEVLPLTPIDDVAADESPDTVSEVNHPSPQYSYDLRAEPWQGFPSIEPSHSSTNIESSSSLDHDQNQLALPSSAVDDASTPAQEANVTPDASEQVQAGKLVNLDIREIDWLTMQAPAVSSHHPNGSNQCLNHEAPELDKLNPDDTNGSTSFAFEAEDVFPSLGLAVRSLKPNLRLQLATLYEPNWLLASIKHCPIDQFTPVEEPSEFHSKLKAVAELIDEACSNSDPATF